MGPSRICVRLPNWVGDVVMATPALRALRRAHKDAHIAIEGRGFLRGLLAGLDSFDEFLVDPGRGAGPMMRRVRALRAGRFDWAVLLPDSASSALGPFLARIRVRAGYRRDALRGALLTHALPLPTESGHRVPIPMIERYLRVTRSLGCPDEGTHTQLATDPASDRAVDERLERLGVPNGQGSAGLLVVTPGANFGSSKLWPPEHFARAADAIAAEHGVSVVIAPGPGEEEIARAVGSAMRSKGIVLEGPVTSLSELKSLIARARLVLSNDTGPRAMAVALNRPVVVLMGPTDPRHTAMHLERQRVLREEVECSPCHLKTCPIDHRCMTRLTPERAVLAARELLS
jgi:heptosyltransferase-2